MNVCESSALFEVMFLAVYFISGLMSFLQLNNLWKLQGIGQAVTEDVLQTSELVYVQNDGTAAFYMVISSATDGWFTVYYISVIYFHKQIEDIDALNAR